jgi:Flp pilus assembly protein TadG
MRARGIRSERGQALAEFALVMPLVLLFIAGIVEMGRAWNIKQAVTDAAREGARYAVIADGLDCPGKTALVEDKVEERLALASIESSVITVTCVDVGASERTVTVSTQHKMGLIGALLGWAGAPSAVTIGTQATMRNEQQS